MPLSKGVGEDAHHIIPRALLALRQYNPQIKRFLKERKKEKETNVSVSTSQQSLSKCHSQRPRGHWTWNIWWLVPSHVLLFPAVFAENESVGIL